MGGGGYFIKKIFNIYKYKKKFRLTTVLWDSTTIHPQYIHLLKTY